MKIINFKKEKMILLTNKKQELYEKTNICYICKIKLEHENSNDQKYRKVKGHCHYTDEYSGTARSICNLKYGVPKVIPVVFHNALN